MADINLPSNFKALIRTSQFSLGSNTQIFESPLSRYKQRSELDGARWKAVYTTIPMRRATFAPLQAVLMQLKGQVNRMNAFDPDATTPLGSNLGTPLVDGASQTGNSISTKGWTINQTGLLLPGDYFSVNGEYKMVTASVDSDGSGLATVLFEPPLRASPSDSGPLTTTDPKCLMALESDDNPWSADQRGLYTFSFSAVEVFS